MKKKEIEKEIGDLVSTMETKSRLREIFNRLGTDELSDDDLIAFDILLAIENSDNKSELEKARAISQILSGNKNKVTVDVEKVSLKELGEIIIDELFASLKQKVDETKYPDTIFFFKDKNVLAEYKTKSKFFMYYDLQFWMDLKQQFNYTDNDCLKLAKDKIKKYLNLKPSIISLFNLLICPQVNEHFNFKLSEKKALKEQNDKQVDDFFYSLEQKIDEIKYPDYFFFFKDNELVAQYNTIHKTFYYHDKLKLKFIYTYDNYRDIIKNKVEKYLNLKPSTITIFNHSCYIPNQIEKHFRVGI